MCIRDSGLSTSELIKVYKTCIRPCAEYASVVLHPMMTAEQSDMLESQQTQALRNIYGFGVSAARMRAKSGLETLRARRVNACTRFAGSLTKSPRFSHWVERRQVSNYPRRGAAVYGDYIERPAKTDRCYNSPLYYYRRLLNGRVEVE